MVTANSLTFFLLFGMVVLRATGQRPLRRGSACKLVNSLKGFCRPFNECPAAIDDLHKNGVWPLICVDNPDMPIICCDTSNNNKSKPTEISKSTTTTTTTTTSTTPRPRPTTIRTTPSRTTSSTTVRSPNVIYEPGVISGQKCSEYSKWISSPILSGGLDLKMPGQCGIKVATFIIGGTLAGKLEFPHMVHLGYGDDGEEKISYQCGGSLISETFVLTAAHCIRNRDGRNVSHARMGLGDPNSIRILKITEIIPHPEYKRGRNYNDIALLRLEREVKFSDYRRPACLQVTRNFSEKNGTATGWGTTETNRLGSKELLKVNLPFMKYEQCANTYMPSIKLEKGLDDRTMVCAGAINLKKDTCQGDSGGPLQIVLTRPECMYSIVGITSFGFNCGIAPGVYTRVSAYIEWIEGIVWPLNS